MNTSLYILGHIDGHLEPQHLDGEHWQADQQAKADYRDSGACWIRNPATDQAERKRFERDLDAMEKGGLIFTAGKNIGMTSAGDSEARRLAGLPTLNDAYDLLAAIATSPDKWDGGWVSECSLCGCDPLPPGRVGHSRVPEKRSAMMLAYMSPLLAARLVTWRQVQGMEDVFLYGCTQTGFDAARLHGDASQWVKRITRPRSFDCPDEYAAGWSRAYQARQHATPARANLVHHLDPVDPPTGPARPSGTLL
jgi:hypothetical protein